jgi:GLPGLI family protein
MKYPFIISKALLITFILMLNLETQAQTNGEVIYKCTLKDNTNVFRDTLRFKGNEIKYIKNKASYEWKSKEGYSLSIDATNDTWFFNLKTRESTYKKYDFNQRKYNYSSEVLKPIEWTILNEFKTIGKYKVQKATAQYDSEAGKLTKFAWFTTEIPIQAGPCLNWGLPGLILEVKPHKIYTCTMESIVLKPVEDLRFNENATTKTETKKPNNNKKKLNALLNKD